MILPDVRPFECHLPLIDGMARNACYGMSRPSAMTTAASSRIHRP
jgi:hypothetical protein